MCVGTALQLCMHCGMRNFCFQIQHRAQEKVCVYLIELQKGRRITSPLSPWRLMYALWTYDVAAHHSNSLPNFYCTQLFLSGKGSEK